MKLINQGLYQATHPKRTPVNLVKYSPAFPALQIKRSDAIPGTNDILKPEKLVNLITQNIRPLFDAYANMLATDSSFFVAAQDQDPFLNLDFFITEL